VLTFPGGSALDTSVALLHSNALAPSAEDGQLVVLAFAEMGDACITCELQTSAAGVGIWSNASIRGGFGAIGAPSEEEGEDYTKQESRF